MVMALGGCGAVAAAAAVDGDASGSGAMAAGGRRAARTGDTTVRKRSGWSRKRALMRVWSFPTKWKGGYVLFSESSGFACGWPGASEGGGVVEM
jgi:hypothetical protein